MKSEETCVLPKAANEMVHEFWFLNTVALRYGAIVVTILGWLGGERKKESNVI